MAKEKELTEGIEQGIDTKAKEIAKSLLATGVNTKIVSATSQLSIEELNKLQRST